MIALLRRSFKSIPLSAWAFVAELVLWVGVLACIANTVAWTWRFDRDCGDGTDEVKFYSHACQGYFTK